MYTQQFIQTGNSCAAATLMIALHEFYPKNKVDSTTEQTLYGQTRDAGLSNALGISDINNYYSSPANIKKTAEGQGLKAALYEKKEIQFLPADVAGMKANYIDPLNPRKVDTAAMKKLLDSGPLQLLVYVGGNITTMHWLLLRKNAGAYHLYDTAFGTNTEIKAEVVLDFNAQVTTGRPNNFLGVAFHLTK